MNNNAVSLNTAKNIFRILQHVFDDSKIPVWAGFHHETLNGDGYPFKNDNNELDLECRIIAVADIFQALAQERPYRHTMSLEYILNDLQSCIATISMPKSLPNLPKMPNSITSQLWLDALAFERDDENQNVGHAVYVRPTKRNMENTYA